MSRTTRRRPYGFNPGEVLHEQAKVDYETGDKTWRYRAKRPFDKHDIYHNRDASSYGAGKRGAYSGGPKGYSSWDTVPTSTRRFHSRAAARVLRRRGKDDIQQQLGEE